MFDVITCGSATMDSFIHTKQDAVDMHRPQSKEHLLCYPVGAKLLVDTVAHKTGGGGTNTAVSFARLGLKTGYVGSIGKDQNGTQVLEALKKEKVTFLGVRSEKDTDCSFILDSIAHDRTILVYREASNDLRMAKLPKTKLKAKWLYCSALVGEATKTVAELMAFAKKQHMHVAFNPSEYLIREQPERVREMLHLTDALILNREEAALLLRQELPIDRMLRQLQKLGPNITVITDGKRGTHAADAQHVYFAKPHQIKIAEATGAGDAFASAFVTGLAKTGSMVFALELGTTNAESCIQHVGAKEGLLSWKKAMDVLHHQPVIVQRSV